MKFDGFVYVSGGQYTDSCRVIMENVELERYLDWLGKPGKESDVKAIIEGKYQISKDLVNFVTENKNRLMQNAIKTLLGGGYGPTEDQLIVIGEIMDALKSDDDKAFFIRGVSGSGKTLVAITLFFEALSRGYNVLLAYKNNRLLNTLRTALGSKLSGLIRFYSTGPQGRYQEVAEKNFPVDKYGSLDLVIYDEAQRMNLENIKISLERSRIKVYLYDDEQVLIGDEAGTKENFITVAKQLNKEYFEYELSTPRRIPPAYLKAVRELLNGSRFDPSVIDFRIFDNIQEMLNALKEKHLRGHRVALVCAFTETPGNKKNRKALDNLRIGYPLCKKWSSKQRKCLEYSNLDIYKELNQKIFWLMDEKTEYPRYWMGKLDPLKYCASVYGAQGFEAEYVGVIWGRDLILRNGWTVNPEVITDNVGGKSSLASIARRGPIRALQLLKNRYLILLTRGTKGVYVYFEDEQTRDHIKSLLS